MPDARSPSGKGEIPVGSEFGRLRVVAAAEPLRGKASWLCRCSCPAATEKRVLARNLKSGHTSSCGCVQRERATRHGGHGTAEYRAWERAVRATENPKSPGYAELGGRGVRVCPEWRNSFERFLAAVGPRPEGTVLVRLDAAGDFTPGNVAWRPKGAANRPDWKRYTAFGRTLTLAEWARERGLSPALLRCRIAAAAMAGGAGVDRAARAAEPSPGSDAQLRPARRTKSAAPAAQRIAPSSVRCGSLRFATVRFAVVRVGVGRG